MARFQLPNGQRYEVAAQYWMPSLTAVVLLFMGGWFAASFSQADDAGGAFIRTMTVKGKVVRVKGRPVRVLVPETTTVSAGSVITVKARTINLTQMQTQTARIPAETLTDIRYRTVTGPTTTVTTETVGTPVTVTETVSTVTDTQTATVTTTITSPPPTS